MARYSLRSSRNDEENESTNNPSLSSEQATTTPSILPNNTTMDLIDKYQRQVNKLKKVIKEDEDPNLAMRHKEQLDEALTNLENATTAHAKRTTRCCE